MWARILSCLLTITLIAGVAAARERPPIKTVGVISDVGDKVRLQHIGFTVFTNFVAESDFPDWTLDAFITAEIETALKARYELHPVTFAKGSIAPDLKPRLFHDPNPEDNVRANARPADGQPLDAYVVVWPSTRGVIPTNQFVQGVGLLTRSSYAWIYAVVRVSLIDGNTFEEIDTCLLKVPGRTTDDNEMREARDLYVEKSLDEMTPDQRKRFEDGVKGLLHDGLAYCLTDVKLLP